MICGILAPIAQEIGNSGIRAIDAGRRDPGNRGNANAGRIMGMLGSILLIVGLIGDADRGRRRQLDREPTAEVIPPPYRGSRCPE